MKILSVTPTTTYFVETYDGDYRTDGKGSWERRYGESWEPESYDEAQLNAAWKDYHEASEIYFTVLDDMIEDYSKRYGEKPTYLYMPMHLFLDLDRKCKMAGYKTLLTDIPPRYDEIEIIISRGDKVTLNEA